MTFNHTQKLDIRHEGGFELSPYACDRNFPANSTADWHTALITGWSGVAVKVQDRPGAAPARCIRYNWWRAPCMPAAGPYNCAIYGDGDSGGLPLPAPPFVLDVTAGRE